MSHIENANSAILKSQVNMYVNSECYSLHDSSVKYWKLQTNNKLPNIENPRTVVLASLLISYCVFVSHVLTTIPQCKQLNKSFYNKSYLHCRIFWQYFNSYHNITCAQHAALKVFFTVTLF